MMNICGGGWGDHWSLIIGRCFFLDNSLSQVIEHHVSGANPGMVGLAISYALGITGKLSGLVTSFTGSFHTDDKQKKGYKYWHQQRLRGSWWLWNECSNT